MNGDPVLQLLVSYDIVDDYRRLRLAKYLQGQFERVQKSVFEGTLAERRLEELRAGIARRIDRRVDSVRIYQLCLRCRDTVEVIGTGSYIDDEARDIVV